MPICPATLRSAIALIELGGGVRVESRDKRRQLVLTAEDMSNEMVMVGEDRPRFEQHVEALGKTQDAMREYEMAVRLAPDRADFQEALRRIRGSGGSR